MSSSAPLKKNKISKYRKFFSLGNPLLYILILGLLLRLLFIWKGAGLYYGSESTYSNGDTFSYVLSFENLIQKGHYTFDETIPDASFGRLPGFPFFYGVHYLIFGKDVAYTATALTQALLDTLAIFLIFSTIFHLSRQKLPAYIGALLYATYPFIIVWVSIMGSELLANFFIILYFYILVTQKKNKFYFLLLGIVLCFAFYTREFLGILVPITISYLFITEKNNFMKFLKHSFIFGLAFMFLYLPWPIRNYVNHNRIMPIKTAEAGYPSLAPDALGYLNFVDSWSVENNFWFEEMKKETKINFPPEVFKNEKDAKLAQSLVTLGRLCGSGFYLRKFRDKKPGNNNCDQMVGDGFEYLAQEYKQENLIKYWIVVPILKLKKALFKTQLINNSEQNVKQFFATILFFYRSLLILLGIVGLFYFRRLPELLPIAIYFVFIYFYLCFIHRSVEIRYFLQADVLLLIPGSLIIYAIMERLGILKQVLLLNQNYSRDI